jgi:hypothetical protein
MHTEIPGNPSMASSLEGQILSNLVDQDGMGTRDGTYSFANGGFDLGFLGIAGSPGMTRLFTEDDGLSASNIATVPEPGCAALLIGFTSLLFRRGRTPSTRKAWFSLPLTCSCANIPD